MHLCVSGLHQVKCASGGRLVSAPRTSLPTSDCLRRGCAVSQSADGDDEEKEGVVPWVR